MINDKKMIKSMKTKIANKVQN